MLQASRAWGRRRRSFFTMACSNFIRNSRSSAARSVSWWSAIMMLVASVSLAGIDNRQAPSHVAGRVALARRITNQDDRRAANSAKNNTIEVGHYRHRRAPKKSIGPRKGRPENHGLCKRLMACSASWRSAEARGRSSCCFHTVSAASVLPCSSGAIARFIAAGKLSGASAGPRARPPPLRHSGFA